MIQLMICVKDNYLYKKLVETGI